MNDNKYENHTVNPVQDRPDLADKIENKVDVFLDTKTGLLPLEAVSGCMASLIQLDWAIHI